MRMKLKWAGGAAILACILWSVTGFAQESHVGNTGRATRSAAKRSTYATAFSATAPEGDGRGESAPYLDPKPRDFTKAVFKCRSTPSGSLPLDSDLYDTISRGVHASGMPSWKPLLRQERVDLVAYIKTFSSAFQEEKPGTPVEIPPEPPATAESIQRGAALFQSMNCWSCHGKDGRGYGPSAATLADDKGYPIKPFDFTSGSRFKCGESEPGYVPGFGDWAGWNPDALVCRRHDRGSEMGRGALHPLAKRSQDACQVED